MRAHGQRLKHLKARRRTDGPSRSVHRAGFCLTPGVECKDLACPAWFTMRGDGHCPSCEAPMVLRYARATGRKFLGCSQYPRCTGTRSA